MPYVQRDAVGKIVHVSVVQTPDHQEFLADNNAQLQAFWTSIAPTIGNLTISHRQFYQIMALRGLITKDEALAAVQHGTIPKILVDHLAHLTDPTEHFAAEMLLSGANEFQRNHPFVEHFAGDLGMTSREIDILWALGSSL